MATLCIQQHIMPDMTTTIYEKGEDNCSHIDTNTRFWDSLCWECVIPVWVENVRSKVACQAQPALIFFCHLPHLQLQPVPLHKRRTSTPSSTAQHSTAQHSTAQHSTAQHSTAQHSTAQHSTAQHSTAQHSTAHRMAFQTPGNITLQPE